MDNETALKEIRKLQLAQLELVKVFAEICEKEHLQYFMLAGTMLGAIRHKGFIPWDDDVDFGMPRADLDKFLEVADKYLTPDFHLLDYKTTNGYLYYIPRLTSSKAQIKSTLYQNERIEDVSIDILALDGMPDSSIGQHLHEFWVLVMHALYKFSVFDEYVSVNNPHRTWYEKILCTLCKELSLQRLFSPQKRLDARDKISRKYSYEESSYIINSMGAYKLKEMFPKSVFADGSYYEFEGIKLLGPKDYDAYLTRVYGDYMKPPKNLDIGKHGMRLYEG